MVSSSDIVLEDGLFPSKNKDVSVRGRRYLRLQVGPNITCRYSHVLSTRLLNGVFTNLLARIALFLPGQGI